MPTLLSGDAAVQAGEERTSSTGTENHTFRRRRVSESMVLEAARLMQRAFAGSRRGMLDLEEALAVDDFRAAAFEVLDREMMDRYQDLPAVWTSYARRTTVRDFKEKNLVDLMGGRSRLDKVPELTEYPARSLSKALYQIFVEKFGGRFQLSWEAMVNDELGQLEDLPGDLAVGARDTETHTAASLLASATGPNSSYFNATAWGRTYDEDAGTWSGGSTNLLASNPVLSTANLQAAIETIRARKDPEGRPIQAPRLTLVVPPALEVEARNILDAKEIRETSGTTTRIVANWMSGIVDLVVEPWLAVIDQSANVDTTWYLVPTPGTASRPAFFVAFLRGHETPDLRVKADTGTRVGGGNVAPEDGSFDVDDIQYRVRHVVGAAGTDMIATAASNGSGS